MGNGLVNQVYCLHALADGTVLAGSAQSDFNGFGQVSRWNGTAWTNLGSIGGVPRALRTTSSGDVIAVGNITGGVARWDGSVWVPVSGGTSGGVNSLVVLPGDDLLVGGTFTSIGGVNASRVARWSSVAGSWSPMGIGLSGLVADLIRLPDGTIIAGGDFTTTGAGVPNCMARWNGSTWVAMGAGVQVSVSASDTVRWVQCLAQLTTGEVVAGGSFFQVGGFASGHWARWATGRPQVTGHPADATLDVGETLELEATPTPGYAELPSGVEFRWLRNGLPLVDGPAGGSVGGGTVTGAAGVLTATRALRLSITGAQHSDSGRYQLRLSRSCGSGTSAAALVTVGSACGSADFNGDGDSAGDADIEAFFACIAGSCCPACWHSGADFNADGDAATDADIESFFRVLAGGEC
jgi:hypothetical protein